MTITDDGGSMGIRLLNGDLEPVLSQPGQNKLLPLVGLLDIEVPHQRDGALAAQLLEIAGLDGIAADIGNGGNDRGIGRPPDKVHPARADAGRSPADRQARVASECLMLPEW